MGISTRERNTSKRGVAEAKGIETCVEKWQRDTLGNTDEVIKRLEEELERLHEEWQQIENTEEVKMKIVKKIADLWKAYRLQEKEWYQKFRVKWIVEGDKNTRYFHTMESVRKKCNFMGRIEIEGKIYENSEKIKKGVANHFKNFYNQQCVMGLKYLHCVFHKLRE